VEKAGVGVARGKPGESRLAGLGGEGRWQKFFYNSIVRALVVVVVVVLLFLIIVVVSAPPLFPLAFSLFW
jgi:hypothetical protein